MTPCAPRSKREGKVLSMRGAARPIRLMQSDMRSPDKISVRSAESSETYRVWYETCRP